MKRVILRGPSMTQSGYGVHCRQVASWLLSRNDIDVKFQALPWGDTPWVLNKQAYGGLIDKITKNTVELSIDKKYDVSFQLQLPNEWDSSIASYNVGMTAVVETDKCNPEWIAACNKMDLVIVPSKHSADVLRNSGGLTTRLVVVPESYCDAIAEAPSQKIVERLPRFSTDFNFLIFGQITGDNPLNDRKNTFFTIKWLCEAFRDDPSVGIVVKTNMGRNTPIDARRTKQLMQSLVKEVRRGDFPKIHLLHGDMGDDEVAALYKHNQIKSLVTLTRGEGYGLPILEAAASGLPVIATGWSGHTDFLESGKYISVSYDLKEVHGSRIDNKIFVKGSKWAEASEEDFKKKVIKFRNGCSIPQQWAKEMAVSVGEKYSTESIRKAYDEVSKEALG